MSEWGMHSLARLGWGRKCAHGPSHLGWFRSRSWNQSCVWIPACHFTKACDENKFSHFYDLQFPHLQSDNDVLVSIIISLLQGCNCQKRWSKNWKWTKDMTGVLSGESWPWYRGASETADSIGVCAFDLHLPGLFLFFKQLSKGRN